MKLHEISIEITQQCPNNCIHCSSYSSWDATNVLPVGIICNAIKDAVDLGAQQICISGGEPFLHENIVEITQYVHQLGVKCVVYSSGILFDGEKYQSLPKALLRQIKPYVTKVIINYEASDGKTYDMIMGTSCGGYRIMRQSIRSMIDMGISVETHVVPMQINVKLTFPK